jgi:acetylornithine/succinyldiaminopimelate/putrescine aminotransferase
MTFAKAMGGGFPVGAMMSREDYAFSPSDHGGTQSGNPLACAAALATINVIEDEGLVERSAKMGGYLKKTLLEIDTPSTREIRGKGLMVGYEIASSALEVVNYAQERGVLLNNTSENVLRFVPPLVIKKEQIDVVVSVVRDALNLHPG